MVKVNSLGNKVWDKVIGGNGSDTIYSVDLADSTNLIIAGETWSSDGLITNGNNGLNDAFFMKVNSNGSRIWDRTYGGSGSEYFKEVISTSDGGYIAVGVTNSSNGDIYVNRGGNDGFVVKITSTGGLDWIKTFGGSGNDYFYSVAENDAGEFLITGGSSSNDFDFAGLNKGSSDIVFMKLDASGNVLMKDTFGGSAYEDGMKIKVMYDGNYAIVGYTASTNVDITDGNNGGNDGLFLVIDDSGKKVIDKTIGGSSSEYFEDIELAGDGAYYISGSTQSSDIDITDGNNGGADALIIKIFPNGEKIWDKTLGGSNTESAYAVLKNGDNVLAAGRTQSNNIDITDGNYGSDDMMLFILEK